MASTYKFRMDSSDVEALKRALESLGPAGEAALAKIRAAAPSVADAVSRAGRDVDAARERIAGRGGMSGALESLEGRANRARGVMRDLAGTIELTGIGSSGTGRTVQQLAGVLDNIADTAATAALAMAAMRGSMGGIGTVVLAAARAHPVLAILTTVAATAAAAFGVYSASGGRAEQATLSYADAVARLTAMMTDQAEAQRRATLTTMMGDRNAIESEIARLDAEVARRRAALEQAERFGRERTHPGVLDEARQGLAENERAAEAARNQLALLDDQINRVVYGFERMGSSASSAAGGLETLSAIRARLATPRERIEQQFQSTLSALYARRESGELSSSDDYWNLFRRAQGERDRALADLNKPAGGGAARRDPDSEMARAQIGFGRQSQDLADQERSLLFDTQAMHLRTRGTREAQEALADLTASRDRDARAAERAQRIDELNTRAREAERQGLGDVAQAYRDQAAAVDQAYDRIEAAAVLRNRVARDQVAMAESLKAGAAVGRDVGGALSNLFDDIAFKSRNASEAVRDFGIALARAFLQRGLVDPVSSFASNWLGQLFGGGTASAVAPSFLPQIAAINARGNAFERGRVTAFALGGLLQSTGGGVVDRPTLFPMADGAGLMGEAGPEAVMPLRRGADGRLGVAASGGASPIVSPTFNVSVTVQGSVSSRDHAVALGATVARDLKQFVVETVADAMQPGGRLRSAY